LKEVEELELQPINKGKMATVVIKVSFVIIAFWPHCSKLFIQEQSNFNNARATILGKTLTVTCQNKTIQNMTI
jgi:hypothetical protein